ncbi:MAG: TIGR00269 family protein [Candidatus Methanospirareceae archaeon]
MRCKRCGGLAEIRLNNLRFCKQCFFAHFEKQVKRAIESKKMFSPEDKIVVAVSGGKDSLVLWDVLTNLGFRTIGLYIDLGIGGYSERCAEKVERFAKAHDLDLVIKDVSEEIGVGLPELGGVRGRARRKLCSICGLVKRYFLNKGAVELSADALATGHNLDDECAVLLGNLLRWNIEMLSRQNPVLSSTHPKLVKRVKPLFRVTEKETAIYAELKGLDYMKEKCPYSSGASSLVYKRMLNELEALQPDVKKAFYFGFLKGFKHNLPEEKVELKECKVCGMPTISEVCAFCNLCKGSETHQSRIRS